MKSRRPVSDTCFESDSDDTDTGRVPTDDDIVAAAIEAFEEVDVDIRRRWSLLPWDPIAGVISEFVRAGVHVEDAMIAHMYGMSKQRFQQIVAVAEHKLRTNTKARRLAEDAEELRQNRVASVWTNPGS